MSRHKLKKWRVKREVILKRDDYKCRECGRRGNPTPATMVHHCMPDEMYPDYFWESWNLVSLCNACHERMHERDSRYLTKLGEYWRRFAQMYKGGQAMTEITFVIGPPCSGKSTYVKEHAGRNDIVFDYDALVHAMTINSMHDNNPNLMDYVLEIREVILRRLEMETKFERAWIISTRMVDEFYDYFLYNPTIVQMPTSEDECLERLKANPDGRDVEVTAEVIRKYFGE